MLTACLKIWLVWWAGWLLVGSSSKLNIRRESFINRLPHLALLFVGVCLTFSSVAVEPWYSVGLHESEKYLAVYGTLVGLFLACYSRWYLGNNWSGLVAIKDQHELICTGPYSVVRHPIYTGLILATFCTGLAMDSYAALIGSFVWNAAYIIKLNHEEKLLSKEFNGQYQLFCQDVPHRLIPGVY